MRRSLLAAGWIWLAVWACAWTPALAGSEVLDRFSQRVELARKNLPQITKAAEASADRIIAHPLALIDVPYAPQSAFAEEMVNRAGGLANALPPEDRMKYVTPDDVALLSVRAWAKDGPTMRQVIERFRKQGALIVLFASRAGMPTDLQVDFLIDNGAATPEEAEAPINALANVLNAWLWNCEYVAALTRHGKYPGVLLSILMPGSAEFNRKLQGSQEGRRFMGESTTAIAAGELGNQYLQRVAEVLAAQSDPSTQQAIEKAAEVIAQAIAEGKTVGLASCDHLLSFEIFQNASTPMKPFNVVWHSDRAFHRKLRAGDLLVFFAYVGMSTPIEDYRRAIRNSNLRLVACFAKDEKNPDNNAPDAAAVILQHWRPPDAEIAVPFPPGHIAPASGLDSGLLYRMLEEAVARRLKPAG